MKRSRILLTGAVVLMTLCAISCKGRRVDNTPTGDTVEVVIETGAAVAGDTASPTNPTGSTTQPGSTTTQSESVPEAN